MTKLPPQYAACAKKKKRKDKTPPPTKKREAKGIAPRVEVPTRSFYCELKYRPPVDQPGDCEDLKDTLILQVPRLADSGLEEQWAFIVLWNKIYEPEYQERAINQVFIFTSQFGELVSRLETNQFTDETAHKLPPPDPTEFDRWQNKVKKQFKRLYRISLEQWEAQTTQTDRITEIKTQCHS